MRKLRIFLAVLFFAALTIQFLDVYHKLPAWYYGIHPANTVKFAPSLFQMMVTGSLIAGGAFFFFSILALLFGRIYCSFVCPLGILMDLLRWFAKFPAKNKFLKKTRLGRFCRERFAVLGYRKGWTKTRAVILIAGVVAMFTCAVGFLFTWIDPYSLFGKIGGLFHLVASKIIDTAGTFLSLRFEYYGLAPVGGDVGIGLFPFVLSVLILVVIALLAAYKGRIFCNTICPVGAFLGLLSKFSLFKIRIDPSRCKSCGMCEKECKALCINVKEGTVDNSRCVDCFNCSNVCHFGAIGMKGAWKKLGAKPQPAENKRNSEPVTKITEVGKMDRREFGKALPAVASLLYARAKTNAQQPDLNILTNLLKGFNPEEPFTILEDASPYTVKGTRPDKRLTALPGSKSLRHFLVRCTACQICVSACESHILKPSTTQWGLEGFMQPYMDFTAGFCLQDCHKCADVCPTGALLPLTTEQKHVTKIGTALFRKDLCVVTVNENDCSACGEHCPVSAIEMLPYKPEKNLYIPHIHEDVCIGCGACEYICPVTPFKALVVQGLRHIRKAKVFEESMRLYIPETDVKPAPADSKPADSGDLFPF